MSNSTNTIDINETLFKMVETMTRLDARTEHIERLLQDHSRRTGKLEDKVEELQASRHKITGIAIIVPVIVSCIGIFIAYQGLPQ